MKIFVAKGNKTAGKLRFHKGTVQAVYGSPNFMRFRKDYART
jgi:hypothetical protein